MKTNGICTYTSMSEDIKWMDLFVEHQPSQPSQPHVKHIIFFIPLTYAALFPFHTMNFRIIFFFFHTIIILEVDLFIKSLPWRLEIVWALFCPQNQYIFYILNGNAIKYIAQPAHGNGLLLNESVSNVRSVYGGQLTWWTYSKFHFSFRSGKGLTDTLPHWLWEKMPWRTFEHSFIGMSYMNHTRRVAGILYFENV